MEFDFNTFMKERKNVENICVATLTISSFVGPAIREWIDTGACDEVIFQKFITFLLTVWHVAFEAKIW